MKHYQLSRRDILQQAALCAGLALTPEFVALAEDTIPGSKTKRFKIGAVDWDLAKANDPEALAAAAKLGFDGVQVDLGDVETMKNPERQALYLELAHKHKVEIASLALGILGNESYIQSPKAQAYVEMAIDIAVAMKQKVILLAFFGKSDPGQKENKQDALVGKLKENAVKAEKAGVILGLEAEISVETYREIIDKTGSPAVQAYFDTVHAHGKDRDVFQEITSLKNRICEFHAKDYGNILFGKGKIDFHAVRRAMDAIGYQGWIVVEQWGEIQGEKPLGFDATQRTNLKYLREIFPGKG